MLIIYMLFIQIYFCHVAYRDGEWDFFWCDREWVHTNYDTTFLQEHQKILHFRNHYEVSWHMMN